MKIDRKIGILMAAALLALMALGTDALVVRGVYSWALGTGEYRAMAGELALCYVLLALCFTLPGRPKKEKPLPKNNTASLSPGRLAAAGVMMAVFFWCHAVFLPIAAAGLYLLFICCVGHMLNRLFFDETKREVSTDFLLGCAAVILVFCLMSALGIGAIPNLRLAVAGLAVLLLILGRGRLYGGEGECPVRSLCSCALFQNRLRLLMLAFILLMFLLQAGRMNISLDHDTLWYSVRSEYMLDNGPRGIYENMGTVSLVYTYSKGWEILTLPLCDLPSHSFLLAFNLWVTALVLWEAYEAARQYTGPEHAFLVPFLLAGIPGIMNMGISGKTDNITLLFQLILIRQILLYLDSRRPRQLLFALGALFLSWTMKPTAIVFSTAVFGVSVLYIAACRWLPRRAQAGGSIWGPALSFALFFSALFAVWFRTWLFVGVPATSIFSGIFQKLGFTIRYPFLTWDLPDYGARATLGEAAVQLLGRLWGVFVLPSAQDMDRVLISWCSLVVVFFAMVWAGSLFLPKEEASPRLRRLLWYGRCLMTVMIPASIYSIYSLKKVDGNYFILLYTLVVMFGCVLLGRLSGSRFRSFALLLMVPLTLFDTMMVSLSNLAWSVGFSEVSFVHPGYEDHEAKAYQEMAEGGNAGIWEVLASDPQNRVIAFGAHPEVLSFPCNVQSYVDISSSSGNEMLVESPERFREYMAYAKTDYVYVQAGNMAKEYMGYQLLRDCIQEGILTDLRSEEGNILAAVDLEGEAGRQAQENLRLFDAEYVVKEGK